VPHLQGGGDNKKGITHVEMDVNFANGEIKVNITEYIEHRDCATLPDAEIVDQLLEKYWDKIDTGYRELGQNSRYRSSDEIGRTVARLYYEAGIAKWGNEYDIVLAGGSINTRSPYEIQAGMVQYSDLQMILPFDNKVMLCKISGRNLIEKFFENSKYYIYSELSVEDIDPQKEYYIVADTWTSGYAWVNCTEIACYGENVFARDILADYIAAGNWE
jgi:2',3'-cyclic-nucleotide 2'-phosphodiesterase (5'-nucleotidase family)